jgi:two-component system cell cycle response regulator DivK
MPAKTADEKATCLLSVKQRVGTRERRMAKVLVVEDNDMNRDMLTRRLERKGYQVHMAMDGQQGVSMARADRPDLILLDMSLPSLDGWEVARQIKADPITQHIPIIALTAHVMAGDREKCLSAGCDDYDTKPVDLPRLLEKMQALLLGSACP